MPGGWNAGAMKKLWWRYRRAGAPIWCISPGDAAALHLACCYDLCIPEGLDAKVYELLAKCNERLWIGHFGLWLEERMPLFRHTLLFSNASAPNVDHFEELIDIGVAECERFFPAFNLIIKGEVSTDDAINGALLEPMGEA